ncbi:MAG: menaquinone biosynthesis protein [Desulfobacteraceae bacterium]|nr:menaquinone biosynthesis protein [Desulfobacteraceae bacterium]
MGKISYINASPVYYGLDKGLLPDWLRLLPEVPAVLNQKLLTKKIDISPISAAFYAMHHDEFLLLPDLSISCHGSVLSVLLASHFEMEALTDKKIVFSKESATSASFLKMIFASKKIKPRFETGPVQNIEAVSGDTDAVLVIGDVALTQPWAEEFEFCTDLGKLWFEMTGLPFVFAVWAVRKSFARQHPSLVSKAYDLLLESRKLGYANMDQIIQMGREKLNLEESVIEEYFNCLYCDLDQLKINAMERFFTSLFEQGILSKKAKVRFF